MFSSYHHPRVVAVAIARQLTLTAQHDQLLSLYKSIVCSRPFASLTDEVLILISSFLSRGEAYSAIPTVCLSWCRAMRCAAGRPVAPIPTFLVFDSNEYKSQIIQLQPCGAAVVKRMAGARSLMVSMVGTSLCITGSNDYTQDDRTDATNTVLSAVAVWLEIVVTGLLGLPHFVSKTVEATLTSFQSVHTIGVQLDEWSAWTTGMRALRKLETIEIHISDSDRWLSACPGYSTDGRPVIIPGHDVCTILEIDLDVRRFHGREPQWSRLAIAEQWPSVTRLKLKGADRWFSDGKFPSVGGTLVDVDFWTVDMNGVDAIPYELRRRARRVRAFTFTEVVDAGMQTLNAGMRSFATVRDVGIELEASTIELLSAMNFSCCGWRLERLSIACGTDLIVYCKNVTNRSRAMDLIVRMIQQLTNDRLTFIRIRMGGWASNANRSICTGIMDMLTRTCIATCPSLLCLNTDYLGKWDVGKRWIDARMLGRHARLQRLELADCLVVNDEAEFVYRFPRVVYVSHVMGKTRIIGRTCWMGAENRFDTIAACGRVCA